MSHIVTRNFHPFPMQPERVITQLTIGYTTYFLDLTLRFDDRLTTVLKGSLPEGSGAATQWRQVVDLLAQKPAGLANQDVQAGLTRLRDLHERVSEQDRLTAVQALNGRLRSAPLLVYLTADSDAVCDAAMAAADLTPEICADAFPRLSPRAQQQLREQGFDMAEGQPPAPVLPTVTEALLSDDGPEDEVAADCAADPADDPAGQLAESQISALVEKIADYQKNRPAEPPRASVSEDSSRNSFAESLETIRFETDESGTINWTEGPPKGAIVGVTIAQPAFDEGPGPDAYGAAAFRQRMPMENARMRLCGGTVVTGDWRMSAIPCFSEETGRFEGYRGIMRRPNIAEDAGQSGIEVERREQLQQLIHELRTPLNAVIGFSEIIEQQLFGPASYEYRSLARNIMDEARRLLAGFEDLDIAVKVDSGQLRESSGTTRADWLFERMAQRLQGLTHSKLVELNISKAEPVRPFALDGESVERIFARLLSAAIISCENGETLKGELRTRIGVQPTNRFTLSRPSRIKDVAESKLLDPSQGIDGEAGESSLLGLGFSLRLVRNLAQSAGGSLTINADNIALTLPAATTSKIKIRETESE
ncbi:histidine kinase dimerization/phospho-acceptor domain-containing protein [uncultured Parasphingorhabdus sp.]|uniref:sensor histidine kinase n=1 Tax=uncultured Parasphingorhabdus sp. TaxID=2709694 RepID=UPI002AA66ACA|nr:histidine kinase dimerization/phospho-acceptor domain-containing protein [uncultured Parasphingorhabdus sp.]